MSLGLDKGYIYIYIYNKPAIYMYCYLQTHFILFVKELIILI
jgi:hypothetical protein